MNTVETRIEDTRFYDMQNQIEKIKSHYTNMQLCEDDQQCISFCKELSVEWITSTLPSLLDDKTAKVEKAKVLDLQNECKDECDTQIYSYFLYFCGILFLLREKEDDQHRLQLAKFLNSQISETKDSNRRLLFKFLIIFIHLVDPEVKDITVFRDLKTALSNDDDDIIFDVIEKEHELMMKILNQTPKRNESRLKEKIGKVFPTIERKYIKNNGENIIESIIQSGIARLYSIGGRESEHIDTLIKALQSGTAFPHNSFALVQAAHLLVKVREPLDVEKAHKNLHLNNIIVLVQKEHLAGKIKVSDKDYLGASEDLFEKVIRLIDDDRQFEAFSPFNHRIKFEALIGLAYIYYTKGQYISAEEKYVEANEIIDKRLHNKSYLKSILWINRGRNRLDNLSIRSNIAAKKDFEKVLRTYETADADIKDELGEIAARAHNNLGIYYLNEGLYDKAEQQFIQAIDMDDTSPHARFNLGVLYYKKGEETRALTLFRNAYNLDSTFSEARNALDKLGASKKGNLGSEWYDWWFINKKDSKGTIGTSTKRIPIRTILAIGLIVVMITAFGTLAYQLYLQDLRPFLSHIANMNASSSILQGHDVDENAFLIIIAVGIAILMLPFMNKLKLSDVEIELETAGYRPVGPASVTAGFEEGNQLVLRNEFFFARFWY